MTEGRRISDMAPPGAKYFRLYYTRFDGSRIWIPENHEYYTVGSELPDLPPGPYVRLSSTYQPYQQKQRNRVELAGVSSAG